MIISKKKYNNDIIVKKSVIIIVISLVGLLSLFFTFNLTLIQKNDIQAGNLSTLSSANNDHFEEKILNKLTIEEKIGQLFIIGFEGKNLTSEIEDLFNLIHPGGVILLSRNIENENQLKKLIQDLQNLSLKNTGLPLFVAVDQEGGFVRRIPWLTDNIAQSDIENNNQAYRIGFERGNGLGALGINLNLAPVLDITNKGDFLHARSFQKKPELVGDLAKNLTLGQKHSGIFTAIKHFPGYGGISFNPEKVKIPVLSHTPEFSHFQKASEAQPEFIMTSNVFYLDIDGQLPFTLSEKGIQFLKEQVSGDYLILSDDLSSNALKKTFPLRNSVVLAKKAGVDVLLIVGGTPHHQDQINAFNALLQALQKNEINEKQINDSVLRIIKLKQKILQMVISKREELDLNEKLNIVEKPITWGYKTPKLPRSIDTIIIHSSYNALGRDPYNVDGVIYEYKLYRVAPHYLIDRNGTIFRLVKEENIAYHAGKGKMPDGRTNINSFSIGIELINTKTIGPNEAQYVSLVKLVRYLKSKYEIKYILGHNQILPNRKTDPWNFDWKKFKEMLKN